MSGRRFAVPPAFSIRKELVMHEVLIETDDRSYYTDRLTEFTGKPRIYWVHVPFPRLKQIFVRKIKEKGEVIRRD